MLARGSGKIVNIASLLSFQGGITVPAYAASKGGVAQLTKALANEWAGKGVNVNAIAPGYIDTDNTARSRADPVRNRQIIERIPAGRWGEPDDLAGAAVFLSSPRERLRHGHVLVVDGGWMGRGKDSENAMPRKSKPQDNCRFDLVALGEVMLRLDPGEGRVHTTRSFQVWEGGGEYNVARGLRRCFGLRHGGRDRAGRQPGRAAGEDLIYQGGVDQSYVRWVRLRRRGPHACATA